ncbi:MAG: N-acetyl-gamma-glutamyl-phosphate reductase [Balneolaceae bacterium]|nr:N-acetyl-gamma-glutamyl-phosphate reductase [Balneolaceae bacterium]MBO6545244.1 N-acetyl-gamma-glutamyl-phosphate reductase [Balneolaceae bacterium]MBO6646640.1 N-acetyl-gamma-glutamyl-phosphate reductase [Balneolaceae bacterium]
MIKVSIIGGAGYTAGELLRLLNHHPETEVISVMSRSHKGKLVSDAHLDLEGETELVFSDKLKPDSDVIFLCSGHGKSKEIIESELISSAIKVIDLSSDFRIKNSDHNFIYGLPELNREEIKSAHHIANPGCFATCIQLSLLPLASVGLLNDDVHVTAITGSTGAGQNHSSTTHFSWRSNNASVYKAFTHQHLGEIKQSLNQLQNEFNNDIHFIPMRGAFARGILAACYLKIEASEAEIKKLYQGYYSSNPFVHLSETELDVKRVVNTNKAILHLKKEGGQILITGVIDNLVKGASGQAIQNMNLMFGLEETTGLNLKSSVF